MRNDKFKEIIHMNKDKLRRIVLKYISEIESTLGAGDAREHAYRPAFIRKKMN